VILFFLSKYVVMESLVAKSPTLNISFDMFQRAFTDTGTMEEMGLYRSPLHSKPHYDLLESYDFIEVERKSIKYERIFCYLLQPCSSVFPSLA
jgi:hypothetical protein